MAELPSQVAVELQAFLRSGASGSFTIHADRGVVKACEVKRSIRVDERAKTSA